MSTQQDTPVAGLAPEVIAALRPDSKVRHQDDFDLEANRVAWAVIVDDRIVATFTRRSALTRRGTSAFAHNTTSIAARRSSAAHAFGPVQFEVEAYSKDICEERVEVKEVTEYGLPDWARVDDDSEVTA